MAIAPMGNSASDKSRAYLSNRAAAFSGMASRTDSVTARQV